MEELTSLLGKLSVEDIEKLKLLMSFTTEVKEVVTLRAFADEYFDFIKQNRSADYYTSVKNSFKHLFEFFSLKDGRPGSKIPIQSIGLKDFENFISIVKIKVPKGYRVYVRTLKAAFNKSVEWGYGKENFFTKIKLPKRQKTAPAFINSDQLSFISSHIENDVVRNVVVFAFYTGMRLDEIVNLRWKNVNLNNKVITVGDEFFETKGRKQRYIPISDEAMEVLFRSRKFEGRRQNGKENPSLILPFIKRETLSRYVFCKSNGDQFTGDYFSKRFKRACKAAGMDETIHFHSLRHSFASSLVQKGVSLYKVKELLGHSSISTTEIYSHLNMDTLREAISKLDDLQLNSTYLKKNSSLPGLKLIIKN